MASHLPRPRGSFSFLKTELSVGLTFASIANQATDEAKIQRNLNAAQRAYDTVCRFRRRVVLAPDETQQIELQLDELRRELRMHR